MRRCVLLLPALALLAGAPSVASAADRGAGPARAQAPRPKAFSSCSSLVGYARRGLRRTDGTTGVPTRAAVSVPAPLAAPAPLAGPRAVGPVRIPAAAAPGSKRGTPDFSGTNVQEPGIDEPDIVKTDGRRIVAIAGGALHVIDLSGPEPRRVGRLALEGRDQQLLIRGNRALVMATTLRAPSPVQAPNAPSPVIAPAVSAASTVLTEVDLSDPAAPAVRRTLALDGVLVGARLTGGTARIVVASSPALGRRARPGLRTFVPRTLLRSRVSHRTFRRAVVPCDGVRRPASFSGLDLLTVLTVDLDQGLLSVDRDAIMAGAQTVYASQDSLYVASRRCVESVEDGRALPGGSVTEVHRFDASRPGATGYAASGTVPGFVLDQYALSEHAGALRVASTSESAWFPDGRVRAHSESFVTVLREGAGGLARVGQAQGLGRGERIFAVRFQGEAGYVVTFRQTDPLYTLDLSDPADPRVLGELKILGYSAYLHPLAGGRLLGVGQDATEAGRRLGAQVSLFDVSDLRRPRRIAQASLGEDASTTAEFDPHAFLYWEPASLAVIPLERFGSPPFAGVIGFRVGPDALAEAGRIVDPAAPGYGSPPIGRTLVVGDRLYTLSEGRVGVHRLDTLAPAGFVALG